MIVLFSFFCSAHIKRKKKERKKKENQCVRLEFVGVSRHISRYFEAEMYLKTLQFYVNSSARGAHHSAHGITIPAQNDTRILKEKCSGTICVTDISLGTRRVLSPKLIFLFSVTFFLFECAKQKEKR